MSLIDNKHKILLFEEEFKKSNSEEEKKIKYFN